MEKQLALVSGGMGGLGEAIVDGNCCRFNSQDLLNHLLPNALCSPKKQHHGRP